MLLPTNRILAAIVLVATTVCWTSPAGGVTLLFEEDFEDVALTASPTYGVPDAWTPDGPVGWDVANNLPGIGDPSVGVTEFEGWTFWDKNLWEDDSITGQSLMGLVNRRKRFDFGRGVVAVADPDTWNDNGDPANTLGLFNSLLFSPQLTLPTAPDLGERIVVSFDVSWSGGCCENEEPDLISNQTAFVRARLSDNSTIELLRWESAPFFDAQGLPTLDPFDNQGTANTPNPNYNPRVFNDRIFLDVTDLFQLAQSPAQLTAGGAAIAYSTTGGGSLGLEFGVEDAGDDGWLGLDNVAMYSVPAPMDGDLYIDGVIDAKDIDEFALGLLDEEAYEDKWAGESPGSRGSADSTFDFDDIPWFLAIMDANAVPMASMALAQALSGVPEPSTFGLLAFGGCLLGCRWRNAR